MLPNRSVEEAGVWKESKRGRMTSLCLRQLSAYGNSTPLSRNVGDADCPLLRKGKRAWAKPASFKTNSLQIIDDLYEWEANPK